MADKLTDGERQAGLERLGQWQHHAGEDAIERQFRFLTFSEAFGFMTRVALLAEAAGHHPDWSNSYGRVTIRLTTHDAGGLTGKDLALAEAIDRLLNRA